MSVAPLISEPPAETRRDGPPRREVLIAALLIVAAGALAYGNSFGGAFVYDDLLAIVDRAALPDWARALTATADGGLPTAGRPLVSLSLALNQAWSGLAPWSYHVVNLAIHLATALLLFGCVRRTFVRHRAYGGRSLSPTMSAVPRHGMSDAVPDLPVAIAVALLWTVHPLQTGAVTYIVQRAESLMAFFYLLTLYAFIRATATARARGWLVVSLAACACGMATKEVMVSAPLVLLLYDRAFVAGSIRETWRARGRWHVAFAATWLLLAWLVWHNANRGGTAGFHTSIAWLDYALTQARAIVHYGRLAFWPAPLVFDYGVEVVHGWHDVWWCLLLIAAAVGATAIGVKRNSPGGFLAFAAFAILAPSSSVVPVATETIAEHRMYLPLAAVLIGLVIAGFRFVPRRAAIAIVTIAALGGGALTWRRNIDYRSEFALWTDTVTKAPRNPRAHFNLGVVLAAAGRDADAEREYEAAVRLKPNFASAQSNLADVQLRRGALAAARVHAEAALRINPELVEAHTTLGNVWFRSRRLPDALREYERAVALRPDDADAQHNLGTALSELGRLEEATRAYARALGARPDFPLARFHLGNTFARLGRFDEAAVEYQRALQSRPDYIEARDNLARVQAARARTR